jgi:hypothetical protein
MTKRIPALANYLAYFYLLLLTGGFDLVICQPHYDIKLEFICNIFSDYAASDSLRRLPV